MSEDWKARADAAESALRQVREDRDEFRMSLSSLAEDEFATDETADLPDEGVVFEQGAMWAFAEASRLLTAVLARVGAADTQPEGAGEQDGCVTHQAFWPIGRPVCDAIEYGGVVGGGPCVAGCRPTPTAGSKVDTAPEAPPEDVECCASGSCEVCQPHRYPDLLRNSREEQRRLDNEPCPKCGGDRLRPNFTASDACHAKRVRSADTAPESGEGR